MKSMKSVPCGSVKTDSPYYQLAADILAVAKARPSMTSMRVAEMLKAQLPDFVTQNFCGDCDECKEPEPPLRNPNG